MTCGVSVGGWTGGQRPYSIRMRTGDRHPKVRRVDDSGSRDVNSEGDRGNERER